MPFGQVDLEGFDEFRRAARKSVDSDLPKRLGQANRRIGTFVKQIVDAKADPAAVGEGAGAAVRPSAAKREVLLRVGGKHREGNTPQMQWGKRPGRRVRRDAPKRPYIRQIVEDNRPRIERETLDAIAEALGPVFDETDI